MIESAHGTAAGDDIEQPSTSLPSSELETLREILVGEHRRRIAELETELGELKSRVQDTDALATLMTPVLERAVEQRLTEVQSELDGLQGRITDRKALAATITPVLGQAMRQQVRDAREEMIEALYPIVGELVVHAVAEAIRDLARTVDARMRRSLDLPSVGRRVLARIRGVSDSELILRESLPFEVAEVFLIHRETGLMLAHVSRDSKASPDSDLVSGMLTAIRDFAQQAFGQGKQGQLDEVQYGARRILIEAAHYSYLAVVVDGVEPPGFRSAMRQRLAEVENQHHDALAGFRGDAAALAPVSRSLGLLINEQEPRQLTGLQKWILGTAAVALLACALGTGLAARWAWQTLRTMPVPTPSVTPPAEPTLAPPTTQPGTVPVPSATPFLGLMTGHVWLREGSDPDSPLLGVIVRRGETVEILAVYGDRYQVRWRPRGESVVIGWVPAMWVGTIDPIPVGIVTPSPTWH